MTRSIGLWGERDWCSVPFGQRQARGRVGTSLLKMSSTQKKSYLATALALTGLGSDASDVHLGRGWSDGLDNLHPISMFSPFPFGVEKDNGIFLRVWTWLIFQWQVLCFFRRRDLYCFIGLAPIAQSFRQYVTDRWEVLFWLNRWEKCCFGGSWRGPVVDLCLKLWIRISCDLRGNQIVDERVEQQRQVSSKTEALNVWEHSWLVFCRPNGKVFVKSKDPAFIQTLLELHDRFKGWGWGFAGFSFWFEDGKVWI